MWHGRLHVMGNNIEALYEFGGGGGGMPFEEKCHGDTLMEVKVVFAMDEGMPLACC